MKKMICKLIAGLVVAISLTGLVIVPAFADNNGNWNIGDGRITDKVEAISIDTADVDVFIKTGKENEILISETSKSELSDDQKVHWQLDGTTLKIKYENSIWHVFDFLLGDQQRSLTVTIPEDLVLTSLEVGMASADLVTDALQAEEADFDSASGDMDVTLTGDMKKADFDTASGDVKATMENVEKIDTDSASGNVSLTFKNTDQIKMDAASGDLSVTADNIKDLSADTSSGEVFVTAKETLGSAVISTASGEVTLAFAEGADISVSYSTASGDFSSELPVSLNSSGNIRVSTASGDLSILKAK